MPEDMTRALWDLLPEQYKTEDAQQLPHPYPLLRWLEGPGSIMTRVREFADMAERGDLTTLNTTNLIKDTVDEATTSAESYRSSSMDQMTVIEDDGRPAIQMLETGEAASLYIDPRDDWGARHSLAVGKWLAFSVEVKLVGDWTPTSNMLRIASYGGATVASEATVGGALDNVTYTRITFVGQVTELPEGGYFRTLVWPRETVPVGQGFRVRRWIAEVADTEAAALAQVAEYRDVPPHVLPWLSRMLGIDPSPNTLDEVREAILSRAHSSAPFIGTRQHIGVAAGRVLGSDAPVSAYPHPTDPWVIIVASDVESIQNAGGLAEVWKKLTRLSVAPAGFYIVPMEARVTWDQFDNAKPPTWEEFDAAIRTWNQFDSVGVAFD